MDLKSTSIDAVEHQRSIYDKEYSKYREYRLENWRVSYIKRIFKSLGIVPGSMKGDAFLDIGVGGTGYTVIEAARMGYRAIGIDISVEGMRRAYSFAKQSLDSDSYALCDFIVCSADHLPFRDKAFSKSCSIAVLEHIPNDDEVIKEISRVMKSGGRVFITVPNTYSRIPPIFWIPYMIHDRRVGHLRHYRAEDLARKFLKVGFRLERIVYHAHMVKVLQFILSYIFPHLRRPGSKIWWKLEELDYKLWRIPIGLNVSLVLEKK